MNAFALSVEKQAVVNEEPRVTFVLTKGGEEVLRREARAFSEDDLIAAGDELTRAGGLSPADVDQYLAELIEPVRGQWLRSRDQAPDEEGTAEGPQAALPRYVAVPPGAA